ncbi:iq domain-containing protein d [Stylonychia lemnae]|uniref:Dynein regulatory complex protein 10 n=1 Tax=Stylonychia lemnae TaxID=5949 RepID=A0A078B0X3_STYLE|nr:iq domain-containing protein d [Stylonychia lemnae]|eukprot:CDW86748.1 iq domain-containing protein d [Stylonychia lemnae]
MSKPINVEAQRVNKILNETVQKIRVLSLLNQELFEEISKKEEEDICNVFGQQIGQLLYRHALLEQSFKQNNIGPDSKMYALDDEYLQEESRKVAIDIRKTISNLVRHFSMPALQVKLKATFGDQRSNEFAGFIETFEQLKTLWLTKLTTPLEEEQSIKEQLRMLQSRTQKLKEIRDQKKEHLQKYEEESKEQKEQREYEIQNLKKTIADENAQKEQRLKELGDFGKNRHDRLKKTHDETVDRLKKSIANFENQLAELKKQNKTDEQKLREDYKRADRVYTDNLQSYDTEMKQQSKAKEQTQEQFDQVHHELLIISEEYKQRFEERKKREEILTIMKRKNEEQQKQMNLLHRAADWVQAHWRGLLARREMEKARKGKKKKKKKK